MADTQKRARRTEKYAEVPQRVSDAARRTGPAGYDAPPPGGQPPYGNGPVPYGGGQPPYGNAQPSYGGGQSPYGNGQPPYGGGQPPYGNGQPDYGNGQAPYDGGQPASIPEEWALRQQQYLQQQQAMQQYYQQQAWQQEQHQERERISSQASSRGAFRGYTGSVPAQGGPGAPAQPRKKGRAGLIVLLSVLAVILVVGGVFALRYARQAKEIHDAVAAYENTFADGVYVDGIHLGGMTPEQGQNSVQSQIQQRNDAWRVTLTYQGTQMAQINAGMLGMTVDIGQVLNDAWAQARYGTDGERYAQLQALKETPYEAFTATPSGDTSVIDNVLAQVKNQIDREPVNARMVSFDPSQAYPFSFEKEAKGLRLDTEALREDLYHMVATMSSGTVELEPETLEPDVYVVDLQKHYMLRSSVYTPVSSSSTEDRNKNIARALESVNGFVLQPGAQFSFNTVVGQRTEANGFFPAVEYAYGEHVMGIGGGVCQASTTVYQAAVCAGLSIVKREPHSDAVSYTEYGKDATVYWADRRKIDLVFRNNTEDPIYMVAALQPDPNNRRRQIAKVMMYGADMGDVRYEIESKTVQELDPPEKPVYVKDKEGTYVTYTDQQKSVAKAKPGYVVESYRVKYSGSTEVERTMLYTDTYEPKAERIYVGVTKR